MSFCVQGLQLLKKPKNQISFHKHFNIFDIGVTQTSISFKNDCKISQSPAEFETHAIDSLNYSLLIGYGWAQTFLL